MPKEEECPEILKEVCPSNLVGIKDNEVGILNY